MGTDRNPHNIDLSDPLAVNYWEDLESRTPNTVPHTTMG